MWIYIVTMIVFTQNEVSIPCPNGLVDCKSLHVKEVNDTIRFSQWKYCEKPSMLFMEDELFYRDGVPTYRIHKLDSIWINKKGK